MVRLLARASNSLAIRNSRHPKHCDKIDFTPQSDIGYRSPVIGRRIPGLSIIAGESFFSSDFCDAFHAPRSFQNLLQVGQVLDLDRKRPCDVAV